MSSPEHGRTMNNILAIDLSLDGSEENSAPHTTKTTGRGQDTSRGRTVLALITTFVLLTIGCTNQASPPADPVAAVDRAVSIRTKGCGDANDSMGSGIRVTTSSVLTAAHVVAGSASVVVDWNGSSQRATVASLDAERDLAMLEVEPLSDEPVPAPPLHMLAIDDGGIIVGASSGTIPFIVSEVTLIEMDNVRRPGRSLRHGYIVDALTGQGDSGAGLYRADSLVGLLFAVSTSDSNRSWAVSAREIAAFLDEPEPGGSFLCDAERSHLVWSTTDDGDG